MRKRQKKKNDKRFSTKWLNKFRRMAKLERHTINIMYEERFLTVTE